MPSDLAVLPASKITDTFMRAIVFASLWVVPLHTEPHTYSTISDMTYCKLTHGEVGIFYGYNITFKYSSDSLNIIQVLSKTKANL